ncbi:uncharacterized protein HMPREF1541_05416 [Cyphellophora europaea CBS 101466]|uniref:Uncharacterized protein n=1 Tax=Cyphellophora europaea (strain CBS 101466) TaxID=1220924 RepID=W2RTV2_CYPE1|nr:uncharacterized protein HMPREF1541_05416 [Cyphellophora europaea CBS 101466]ETN39193.1 hypothetical protein HMPREF1541_05416 [Cyphellophora europaea CBS 101466]
MSNEIPLPAHLLHLEAMLSVVDTKYKYREQIFLRDRGLVKFNEGGNSNHNGRRYHYWIEGTDKEVNVTFYPRFKEQGRQFGILIASSPDFDEIIIGRCPTKPRKYFKFWRGVSHDFGGDENDDVLIYKALEEPDFVKAARQQRTREQDSVTRTASESSQLIAYARLMESDAVESAAFDEDDEDAGLRANGPTLLLNLRRTFPQPANRPRSNDWSESDDEPIAPGRLSLSTRTKSGSQSVTNHVTDEDVSDMGDIEYASETEKARSGGDKDQNGDDRSEDNDACIVVPTTTSIDNIDVVFVSTSGTQLRTRKWSSCDNDQKLFNQAGAAFFLETGARPDVLVLTIRGLISQSFPVVAGDMQDFDALLGGVEQAVSSQSAGQVVVEVRCL